MTRRVHITGAHITQFGKLAGRDFDFEQHKFVVLLGPNESAKSTLSEALAWILAGRRSDPAIGHRFVSNNSAQETTLSGTVSGTIDSKPFSIGRSFRIRRATKGRPPAETPPDITIDSESAALANWEDLISVHNGDDFALRYRMTGPYDPANIVDVKELLEALSIGATIKKSPAKVLSVIESKGLSLVTVSKDVQLAGPRSQQNSFKTLQSELSTISNQLTDISNSQRDISKLETSIAEAEKDRDALQESQREWKTKKSVLEAFESILPVQSEIERLTGELNSLSEVSPEWLPAIQQQIRFELAAERLKTHEGALRESESKLQQESQRIGLTDQELLEIDVTASKVSEFNSLALQQQKAVSKEEEEKGNLVNQDLKLGRLDESLRETAEALGIDFEALLRLGNAIPDEMSFGDIVRKWNEQSQATETLVSGLETLRGKEEEGAQNLEDFRKRPSSGGPGSVKPSVAPAGFLGKYQKQSAVALLLVSALAMSIKPVFGLIATILSALAMVVVLRASGSGITTDSSLDEGQRLEDELRKARGEVADRIRKIEESERDEKSLSGRVTKTLVDYGFKGDCDLVRALRIRSALQVIATSVRDYELANSEKARITTALEGVADELSRVRSAIVQLAAELHLSRFSASLSETLMRDFAAVVELRTTNQTNKRLVSEFRAEVEEILGGQDSARSGEELLAEFQTAQALHIERADIDEKIRKSEEKIASEVTRWPQLQTYLENPISDSDVAHEIEVIESSIKDVDPQIEAEREKVFGLRQERDQFLQRDDLAEMKQRESQLLETQTSVAAVGAAWWLAHKIISDIKEEVEKSSQPKLVQRASEIASYITGDAWSGFILDDDQRIQVRQGPVLIDQEGLSAGSKDVLRLAIRLAVAEMHREKNDIALPIFLDDPTASIDDERAPRLFEVLKQFSEHHQLIMTTHDPRSSAQAVAAGAFAFDMEQKS